MKKVLLGLLLMVGVTISAFAQSSGSRGTVTGTVLDEGDKSPVIQAIYPREPYFAVIRECILEQTGSICKTRPENEILCSLYGRFYNIIRGSGRVAARSGTDRRISSPGIKTGTEPKDNDPCSKERNKLRRVYSLQRSQEGKKGRQLKIGIRQMYNQIFQVYNSFHMIHAPLPSGLVAKLSDE